ncbi:TPA: hypothetical protein ACH3X3_007436 [Trebouxia sp. C0006]
MLTSCWRLPGRSKWTGTYLWLPATGQEFPVVELLSVKWNCHRLLKIQTLRGEKSRLQGGCQSQGPFTISGVFYLRNAAKHLEQPYKVITIDLGNNRLTGTLPSFWSVLTQMLKLSLGDNLLTGTLPSSWSNITFLSQPSLLGNKLTRTWPVSWNTMIWWGEVRLQDNEFFGALPRLDSSMHVGLLYLQNNNFSRPLPESWSNTIKTFSVWGEMNFSSNHLTGTVPDTLPSSSLEMVHSLDLSNNDLSGTLPSSLGSLAWCEELNINNSFTGTTPEAWSNLTNAGHCATTSCL